MKVLKTDTDYLTMDDIMTLIKQLSYSQGTYSRLYRELVDLKENSPEDFLDVAEDWESRQFTDPVDFILYIES